MSQIIKKFLGLASVDQTKILLSNNSSMQGRNAADNANINIIKVNSSDQVEIGAVLNMGTNLISNVADPVSAQDVATKNYVDSISGGAPLVTVYNSGSGTHTLTGSPKYIRVRMIGGGGGGWGSGTAQGTSPTAGSNSTFGTSLLTANGGAISASYAGIGGLGGTGTINSPAYGHASPGASGGPSGFSGPSGGSAVYPAGGDGGGGTSGGSPTFGGGVGQSGIANTGRGGGGGAGAGNASMSSGAGGGQGAIVEAFIATPSSSYSYAVGAGGSAGGAGTSGYAGGAGGSGVIIVEEYY